MKPGRRSRGWTPRTSTAPEVGLVVAAALAPGTFAPSLSPRSAIDQGMVTGLATGLHFLLTAAAQDALVATARILTDGAPPAAQRRVAIAVDGAAVPLGLAVLRALPARADDPLRGVARQAAWRLGAPALSGALLGGARLGAQALDDRLRLGGRVAALPLAIPVGLGVAYVLDRLPAARHEGEPGGPAPPRRARGAAGGPRRPPGPVVPRRRDGGGRRPRRRGLRRTRARGPGRGPAGRLAARTTRALAANRPCRVRRRTGSRRLLGLAPRHAADRGGDVGRRARPRGRRGRAVGAGDGERRPREPRPLGRTGPGGPASRAGVRATGAGRPPPGRRPGPVHRDRHGD